MLVMSNPNAVPRVLGSHVCSTDLRARVTSVVLGRWFGVAEFSVDHPDAENEAMSGDDLPGTLPDLSDYATIGCLLGIYDQTRKRRICPDPVYTYAAAYGLTHPKTIEALVAALETTP